MACLPNEGAGANSPDPSREQFRVVSGVAVVGAGVVGSRTVRTLTLAGRRVGVHDQRAEVRRSVAREIGAEPIDDVEDIDPERFRVVVLAHPGPQTSHAENLLRRGCHVVATADDVHETRELLELDAIARHAGTTLVVGATASPGLSGLIAADLIGRLDDADEVHVAFHGTAGPACARQHHDALAGTAIGWHDGAWIERPGGSGRELLWFPEPIGAKDCYRAELADPLLLHRAFPRAERISARFSATRRDRLTARLPMMTPPHREGAIGGLRVEVRGSLGGARETLVAGVAERTGTIASVVATSVVEHLLDEVRPKGGTAVLGEGSLGDSDVLDRVIARSLRVYEYVGSGK